MVGAGFGPSSGMSAAICESNESRLANASRSGVVALVALGFGIVFVGTVSGVSLLYLEEELLGAMILTATVAAVAGLAVWGWRMNRAGY